jgi:hypothetical protein
MNFNCGAFLHQSIEPLFSKTTNKVKGKAIPLQAWTGPEGSGRLRLPDFKTIGT